MLYRLLLLFLCVFTLPLAAQETEKGTDPLSAVKMRSIGPFRGGRANTASGVIGDPMTYYMGNTGGGVWKTDDAGQHWKNISDGFFGSSSIGALDVAPTDPNIVFCGTGEHAVRGVMTSSGDGVYKSTDAGKTWKKIGLEGTGHIARIIIHPRDPNIVFVAAQGALYGDTEERGIFKSIDGGKTWKKVLYVNNRTGCSELAINQSNPLIMYATMWEYGRRPWKVISGGTGSGVYKSVDGGETWNTIQEGLPKELGKMAISVAQSNPDKVYALIESDSEQEKGGLFVSNNAGKSWSRVSGDHRLIQRAWYYIEVFADPQNENMVYVLSAPMLRSIDGGKNWEVMGGTHGDYHDLWINPDNPKNMVVSNDGGAAITFNRGDSWSRQDNMPTAQFYRVNVDNAFPYRVYGGQQDNTSVRLASRELNSGGIGFRSWDASAGGESAFLAFDPDDPRYVLGGSYLGTIEVLDTETKTSTNVMAAPVQYLGLEARKMKYLYNWNAPIIWSKHEKNTYYHAAQYLLRTRDLGVTWEEVSPDLTRNQDEYQGNGGGPYTNEAVGAENYGTISYVIESPHEAGVIWTASDDGLVHVTRDGTKSWQNVTPKDMPECLVNSIDVSPHDPATAYIAATRYKFNDHKPMLYVTRNYGKTWTNISKGIPDGAFTRVIREDEKKKGLLFVGTESGLYVSWDDGANWSSLQLNLPVTPITDLIVRHDDLVIATAGRGFWVMDDVPLIRQFQPDRKDLHAYQPEDVLRVNSYSPLDGNSASFDGMNSFEGVNPAAGVVAYYHIPEEKDSTELVLDIKNSTGEIVRTYTSTKVDFKKWDGGPSAESALPAKPGLNRFVWDLRHESLRGVEGVYIEGSYRGHKVPPGKYTLHFRRGNAAAETEVNVLPNPALDHSPETYAAYDDYLKKMAAELNAMHDLVNNMNATAEQLEGILKGMPKTEGNAALREEATTLLQKLKAWDATMVQRKAKAYDDVENYVNGFTADYIFLMNQSDHDQPVITQPSRDRLEELDALWAKHEQAARLLLNEEVEKLNQALWKLGVGALRVKVKGGA
ncbi:WD40/YVTN/BNR-like repeat-containing protein [Neolewinella persica]|uniref:WD40/YVTN/BNR-like repeat-containing protein n=1 Tax=Neolewinella persica TaxID=70998 RepID=UPI000382E760|nr:hypothetical protein [Neolewinella persica]